MSTHKLGSYDYRKEKLIYVYIGRCSRPVKINKDTYRLKCVIRNSDTSDQFHLEVIELKVNNDIPVSCFYTDWIMKCRMIVKLPDSDNEVYIVQDYEKPVNVNAKYNIETLYRIAKILTTTKPL